MQHITRSASVALVLVAAAGLSACSGSSTVTTTTAAAAASPTASPSRKFGNRPGFNSAEFQKIRDCLTAAGFTVPTPSPRPSGQLSGPPSGAPSGMPSPGASGDGQRRGGGMFALLQNPQALAAIKACGLTVPTFGPRPGGGPAPTASPS